MSETNHALSGPEQWRNKEAKRYRDLLKAGPVTMTGLVTHWHDEDDGTEDTTFNSVYPDENFNTMISYLPFNTKLKITVELVDELVLVQ